MVADLPQLTVEEREADFDRRVTDEMKRCLNRHYPDAQEYEPDGRTINRVEYINLAKHFSQMLRAQLKESYQEYNRSMEGLTFTPDNREAVRVEVRLYFDRDRRV